MSYSEPSHRLHMTRTTSTTKNWSICSSIRSPTSPLSTTRQPKSGVRPKASTIRDFRPRISPPKKRPKLSQSPPKSERRRSPSLLLLKRSRALRKRKKRSHQRRKRKRRSSRRLRSSMSRFQLRLPLHLSQNHSLRWLWVDYLTSMIC